MGGLDVGDPVAHRLVDGVLERRGPAGHAPHLGAQRPHPKHVRRLALDVLLAHEHDARQAEQRARGRGGDAVLAGAGLGDDPRLAEPPGEQRLSERVVDLVGAGMGQVLALEIQAEGSGQPVDAAGGGARQHRPAAAMTSAARLSAR